MEFFSSVFPYDQIDELLQFSSIPFQQHTIQKDTLLVSDVTSNSHNSRQRKPSVALVDIDDNPNDYKRKKITHRDVERQRRQEMAAFNPSLRSLLPLDYLKRSMSDHMHEAVNYITHLERRIEELREKRDELKNTSDQITLNGGSKCLQESVRVEASRAGFRVAVSAPISCGVSVSRVLGLILQEGLVVVSCISTNLE